MKLGLISDTHGFLDPKLTRIFRGVDHILHAGDIGPDCLIAQLESLAPVTAVLGNNDSSPCFPLTKVVVIGELKFLVHHIVSPRALTHELKERISREKPDVVVFGHSHKQFHERIDGVLFVNPGYAGKPRFNLDRSVALLETDGTEMQVKFVTLSND
ncbi:MAG TPA: metallophosphoesterase family protein [Verrucomicrobiae bacterium]|nr:metallophosphoesterase family protein [Verrucomicrobiae bacterium]